MEWICSRSVDARDMSASAAWSWLAVFAIEMIYEPVYVCTFFPQMPDPISDRGSALNDPRRRHARDYFVNIGSLHDDGQISMNWPATAMHARLPIYRRPLSNELIGQTLSKPSLRKTDFNKSDIIQPTNIVIRMVINRILPTATLKWFELQLSQIYSAMWNFYLNFDLRLVFLK